MAQVKNYLTYQALAQALAQSSGQDERRNHWIKFEAKDDGLVTVIHQSFVSAGHQSVAMEMQRKWLADALADITNRAKTVEEDYKKIIEVKAKSEFSHQDSTEPAKKTIKLEFLPQSVQETSQPLSYQVYSPQKHSIYKVYAMFLVK
jgi:hypothetical protein